MKLIDEHGLSVALIDPEELAARPWLSTDRHVDVVRMLRPPADRVGELRAAGFVVKPEMLTWLAELGPDEDDFLARLKPDPRRDIQRAQRRSAVLREEVQDRVDADTLDRFLALYEERVSLMQYGVPYAKRHREAVLHGPQKYFGVFAFEDEELVGGCLVAECPDVSAIRVRFSAVTEHWRRYASLSRTLYFTAMRTARLKGLRYATLGDEPNLYGHLTSIGLFEFKTAMGFRAVPSQDFGDPTGCDEADLVLNFTALNDPGLILGYPPDAPVGDRRLRGYFLTEDFSRAEKFRPDFLEGVEPRSPSR
ncbi:GNAT family N-acetyltransferase [Kitasatospora sp. NPDC059646]|uniref:GNAT family N-acetyltransferase n=1 Tax=Kitasatospora sp. NPDC059646 TaxID=3346893 RepID=UPI0036BD92A4